MNDSIKLPPQSIESEQGLLGSLLIDNGCYERVGDIITEHDFYRHEHRKIYAEICGFIDRMRPADVITVFEALDEKGTDVGGLAYLGGLARNCPSSSNARRYAEIIRDKRIARDLIAAAMRMEELAYGSGDITKRLDEAQSLIASLHEGCITDEPVLIHDVLTQIIEDIDRRFHADGDITGLSTSFPDLDEKTAGLQKGDLIIVAGRPSMGKTALALQIAQEAALNDKAVLIFSLEMNDRALVERTIANVGKISSNAIRTGKLQDSDWHRITNAVGRLHTTKLLIDKASAPSVAQMRAKGRRTKRKHGLDLIVIDYIQLMSGDGDNRNDEVSKITRGLKLLAQDLDVPVIAISQLSRKVEERGDKHPIMSDLRESGSIEQDADLILFVYRDEYYTKEKCLNPGVAEIVIGKQRMGEIGTVYLTWRGEYCRFDNHAGHYRRAEAATPIRKGFSG